MLHIMGAGYAYPDTLIDNKFLVDQGIDPEVLRSSSVHSRHACASLGKVKKAILYSLEEVSLLSVPTDIAVKASAMALERAGLNTEDLGLIIAGCTTPMQTTPSEAQRVGERFGLKIPAYDVMGSSDTLHLHLDILRNWAEERMPSAVLSIATNTPTRHTDYKNGLARVVLGDGAGALVVSSSKEGKLRLVDSYYENDNSSEIINFDLFCSIKMEDPLPLDSISEVVNRILRGVISKHNINPSKAKFIGPQIHLPMLSKICSDNGILSENHWYNVDRCGFCLGSSAYCVLGERWNDIKKGDQILLVTGGIGSSCGYILLDGV